MFNKGGGIIEKILTVKDIQEHLGVSKNKAYEIVKLKSFPKVTIGHRYYIPEEQYNKWINERLRTKVIL